MTHLEGEPMHDDSSIVDLDAARAELRMVWRRSRGLDRDPFAPEHGQATFALIELEGEVATDLGAVTTTDPSGRPVPIEAMESARPRRGRR